MAPFQPFLRRYPGVASILRNGALVAGTQWAEVGLRGVYVLVIGRWLGPELYGAWSYALTAYAFAMMLTQFGLDTLVPLRVGQNRKAGAFLGTTFLLRLGLVVLSAAALAIFALGVEGDGLSRIALLLVLPALIGRGTVLWARAVFLGLDRSKVAFGIAVKLRLAEVVLGLTSLWLGAGLYTLLVLHSLSWLAEAALSLPALKRRIEAPLRFDPAELRGVLREGGVLGLAAMGVAVLAAMPLITTRLVTGDLQVVGQLGLASQIATLVALGAQGLLAGALPVVGRASASKDRRLRHYPLIVAGAAAASFGIAAVVAWAVGPTLVPALLGPRFAPAGELLALALFVAGMAVLPDGAWQFLVARGRRWPGVIAGWAGAGALVLVLPSMVRASGAEGALIAAALGWSLRAAILIPWAVVTARAGDA